MSYILNRKRKESCHHHDEDALLVTTTTTKSIITPEQQHHSKRVWTNTIVSIVLTITILCIMSIQHDSILLLRQQIPIFLEMGNVSSSTMSITYDTPNMSLDTRQLDIIDTNHTKYHTDGSIVYPIDTEQNINISNRTKVLCLVGPSYGNTMNKMLQVATLLHLVGVNGTSVVAFKNKQFISFYNEWFHPRPDTIWINYDMNAVCDAQYDPRTLLYLYYNTTFYEIMYQFQTLIPKESIRYEAEQMIAYYRQQSLSGMVVSVHRRHLEGKCIQKARDKYSYAVCPNPNVRNEMNVYHFKSICQLQYHMISNATDGMTVILFTDHQVPTFDHTFPIISNVSFPVESWMMAISDIHYGNPFSTVDLVAYFWRMGLNHHHHNNNNHQVFPLACYRTNNNYEHHGPINDTLDVIESV